ncbi:alpha/beta hydrolase [Niabella ginsenosidivorans]|uniref:Alpha/beta hydrolase n=1 Tax=Niabella ginsenosidivorans TaxID=1176587 RepID=A0A1A9I514_9BACT|nr:alpha/beta hydrolase [Niabella ginsenosidivorans]ANH81761.1 alpha/beta hydrolase [Niabella ginsenosidivorans]
MKKIFILTAIAALLIANKSFTQNPYPFTVQTTGNGAQSLLFIPGFTCPASVWNETVALFNKQYTCYTLTMAGFAGTPAQTTPSFKKWEEGIAQFIKDQKITPVIIGHSMGGGLALALAADHPDLVKKIVIVDALPCLAGVQNPDAKPLPDSARAAMISQIKSMPNDQFRQMQIASAKGLVADTSKYDSLVQWSMSSDRNTFAVLFSDFINTDLRPALSRITCPTLILLEAPFKNRGTVIEKQYSNLKGARIVYAEKGLHFIMYDNFDWYQQQLATFIPLK